MKPARALAPVLGGSLALALLVACTAAPAQVPDWSLQAQQRLRGADAAQMAERQRLLRDGETALAGGDATAAQQAFDLAALMLHAADTEIALVRTYMQQGEYRRALAFCAHAAGAHRDVAAAAGLYAWLLHSGGQQRYAQQRLDEALRLFPDQPVLAEVQRALAAPWPSAGPLLRALPARLAPYGSMPAALSAPPAGARVVGSATLLADGQAALAPADALQGASALWLRNGLGQTVGAQVLQTDAASGLALLALGAPLPTVDAAAAPAREPFAGRPGHTVEYAARDDAEPAWPLLRAGFLGNVGRDPVRRALGLAVPPGPRGGPVFDEAGRLVGVALEPRPADGARAQMVGTAALRATFGDRFGNATADGPARIALDEVYERGLKLALQLIVQR